MDVIRHLRFFVAVAEEGHFGRAAAALGMTQPPVSHGVRRLEDRLGLVLFDRTSRGVELTADGAVLLPRARLLVADAERFDDEARRLNADSSSTKWGVAAEVDATLITRIVGALRCDNSARVSTSVASTVDLVDQVRNGQLDLAVVEHPTLATGLHLGPVVAVRRWVLVPADHPAASSRAPQVRTLRDLAFSTAPRASNPPAHDLMRDTWRERGLDPDIVESGSAAELFAHVAAGSCFGVTAESPADVPGVAWVAVLADRIALRLRIVRRATDDHAAAAHAIDRVLLQSRQP